MNILDGLNCTLRDQKRRILLLIDNASPHGPSEKGEHPYLRTSCIPPNTTALIQPMDQGVIAAIKKRALHLKNYSAASRSLAEEKKPYHVDVATAIGWLREAWGGVSKTTLRNCWRHSSLLVDRTSVAALTS
ncbi:TPA: hypothetical protein N0F65_004164 [Lagenidium giganteum]|uniref:DDE-1 domain-containing protein n=1 Tax=Lagenidium giganteum TaxID=4803 RepID=A0AAV2ZER6_9STRA|nr:TPA: hypothetical protein N0F65_004164 [Lagenidium giganteum]